MSYPGALPLPWLLTLDDDTLLDTILDLHQQETNRG